MRRTGHAARKEERKNACGVSALKSGGKRPLGRPKHRWEDGIIINLNRIWK
jgi:hypothetical protein